MVLWRGCGVRFGEGEVSLILGGFWLVLIPESTPLLTTEL